MTTTATAASTAGEKLDFKRILPIFVIVLVDLLGLTIIIPLLPLYAATFGADAFTIGLVAAAYPVMQLVGAPLLGGLSDRFGRKPVLIVSQLGTFSGFLMLGFAPSMFWLFLSRIVDGLSGANIVAAQAAITDSTTPQTRAQGLGLIGAAFGLGFILGPIIAGISLAVSGSDYHVPAFIAAAFSLGSVLLTTFWFRETLNRDQQVTAQPHHNLAHNLARVVRYPGVALLLALMFFQQLVFGGFEALLALFNLNRLGLNAAGNAVMFVFVGIIIVAVQGGLIGRWSKRFGERRLIYAGLGLLGVGLIMTALTPAVPVPWYSRAEIVAEMTQRAAAPDDARLGVAVPDDGANGWGGLLWIMVAMIPASLGGAMLSPSINSLITRRVAKEETGGALGVSSALVSGANALTPVMGGALFQALGSTPPFLVGGVMMLVLMGLALVLVKPGAEETPAPAIP